MNYLIKGALQEYSADTIENFVIFLDKYPTVYEKFKEFTFQLMRAGRTRASSSLICERIRWDYALGYEAGEFKINNNYKAMLSRLFAFEFPDHKDFFKFRKVRGIKNPNFKAGDLK